MSQLLVDDIVDKDGGNSVGFSKGINVGASSTITGNLNVTGVLTYEDVTNVDSVGLITARSGIKFGAAGVGGTIRANGDTTLAGVVTATSFVGDGTGLTGMANTANVSTTGLNVVGVSTLGDDVTFTGASYNAVWDKSQNRLEFADNAALMLGTGEDLLLYTNGSNSIIDHSGDGDLLVRSLGASENIQLQAAASLYLRTANGAEDSVICNANAGVDVYYNNTKKFETTNSGTITTGISTVTVGTDLDGYKVEEGSYDTNALNGEFDFELENGHVQTHTGSTAGTYFPDFRVSSSQSLSSVMGVGDVVSCTLIVAASNASHYCTTGIKIDNSTSNITLEWIGSSAPSAGKGAGFDIYSFTIQKTAATPAYLIIGNATDAG